MAILMNSDLAERFGDEGTVYRAEARGSLPSKVISYLDATSFLPFLNQRVRLGERVQTYGQAEPLLQSHLANNLPCLGQDKHLDLCSQGHKRQVGELGVTT